MTPESDNRRTTNREVGNDSFEVPLLYSKRRESEKPESFILIRPFVKLRRWWLNRRERIRQQLESELLPNDFKPWTEEQSRAYLNGIHIYFGGNKPCMTIPKDDEGNYLSWEELEALSQEEQPQPESKPQRNLH